MVYLVVIYKLDSGLPFGSEEDQQQVMCCKANCEQSIEHLCSCINISIGFRSGNNR